MNHNRLISALVILGCIMATGPLWADTDTVDAEIVAAIKAGELKKLELQAVETIKGDAPRMEKDHACRILRVIGSTDSVEALAALLPNEELSHIARYALESMRYPEADKALRDALDKTAGKVKVGIINSLAMRDEKQNVETLTPLLKDADAEIAGAAAWALGRAASPQAVAALSKCFEDANEKTRFAAADGLLNAADRLLAKGSLPEALAIYKQLNRPDAPEHVRMGAFAGAIEAQPDKAVALLTEAIRSSDWKIRGMAIDMIVALKGQGVTERFAADLDKLDAPTQVLMLGALVARGEKQPLRPIVTKAVSSPNTELRALAIKSLGDVGDEGSVRVLAGVIETGKTDEDKTLAASSLRRLPGKNINAEIIKTMKTNAAPARTKLIEILRDRDAAEAVDDLLAAASDSDVAVRSAAFRALADLAGPQHQQALIKLLVNLKGDAARAEAERALIAVSRKLDKETGTEPILAALDSSTEAKCSLLRVLGGIGNAGGFTAVRQALKDGNPQVRDVAIRTLADWPDATAAHTLMEIYQTTSDRTHRTVALRGCVRQLGLGGLPSSQMLSICSDLMKGADRPEEKKLVLSCLAGSADPGAISIVEPLLADGEVIAEAELAMLAVVRDMTGPAPSEAKAAAETLRNKSKNETIKKESEAIICLIDKFEDYVMAWQVSGPYSKPFADPFETAFEPETADAETAEWKMLPISQSAEQPWMFDLDAAIGGQNKAGYVRTWVHSDNEQPARIEFGTDDGNKLWLNGKLIHADGAGGAAIPGEHKINVTLQKGWNALLLKVAQSTGPWQFCMAIRKPNGDKLGGLRIQPAKPTE